MVKLPSQNFNRLQPNVQQSAHISTPKNGEETSISFKRISYNQISVPAGSYMLESSSKRVYYEDLPVLWVPELELPPKLQNPASDNPLVEANAFLHLIPA